MEPYLRKTVELIDSEIKIRQDELDQLTTTRKSLVELGGGQEPDNAEAGKADRQVRPTKKERAARQPARSAAASAQRGSQRASCNCAWLRPAADGRERQVVEHRTDGAGTIHGGKPSGGVGLRNEVLREPAEPMAHQQIAGEGRPRGIQTGGEFSGGGAGGINN